MERDQPEYLAKLPKDRHGIVWVVLIALAIGASLVAALKIYAGTVDGWNKRFGSTTSGKVERPRTAKNQAVSKVRAGTYPQPILTKPDKCIDGTAFRKLPDGGWENMPGVGCQNEQRQNR